MPRCPYCRELFAPSQFHPDQVVCSRRDCQRQRQTDYHRDKRQNDPSYGDQCRDSQEKWRAEHPEYMRNYRRKHGRRPAKRRAASEPARTLRRLLECVKNNVAFNLTAGPATIWLVTEDEHVKNILASAQLIVIEGLPTDEESAPLW